MHQRVDLGRRDVAARLTTATAIMAEMVADTSAWQLSQGELLEGVESAYRLVTQAHAMALLLLAEIDQRKIPGDLGASSTVAWLTASQRMRPGDAKRDLMVAQLIATPTMTGDDPLPGVVLRAGLADGAVTIDQAGAIATGLAELPADTTDSTTVLAEQLLVSEARFHGPAALTRLGHRILERIDPDTADRQLGVLLAREEREAARLRAGTRYCDGHGSVWYKFRFPVGDDAFVWPVLDTLSAPQPDTDGGVDERTAAQRLVDGFVETCRRVQLGGDLPSAGGDRPRALVIVDYHDLCTGLGAGTLVDTGDQLSIGVIRRLCCDAQIIPAVLGGASQCLDLGRARRTFDGPIRVAVIARDRGCIHPGCTRPPARYRLLPYFDESCAVPPTVQRHQRDRPCRRPATRGLRTAVRRAGMDRRRHIRRQRPERVERQAPAWL